MIVSRKTWTSAFLVALLAAGCRAPVGVTETGFEPVYRKFRENVLDTGHVSARTHDVLQYFDLAKLYRDDPEQAVVQLSAIAREEGIRDLHVSIAELYYALAIPRSDRKHFFTSAIYAYVFLFSDEFALPPNPYSDRFRLACDLYNRGLARAMRTPAGDVQLTGGVVETPSGAITIDIERTGFPWGAEQFSTFLPSDTFEVRGLRERVRSAGLGVPLIAVQSPEAARPFDKHVRRDINLPATAFLRLHGGLDELEAGTLRGTIELYLGTDQPSVEVGGEVVPLETDYSAALALMLESTDLWSFGLRGFRGKASGYEAGVFMLQPYQPRRIPVVFIHGTASSPTTWAQTINGLLADSRLWSRYQPWLCLYDTGNPIAYSAALLREKLEALMADIDPEGQDPALSRTVLIGHSQGGLVTRLLVTESSAQLWSAISDKNFDDYPIEGRDREILERCLFFEPLPFVDSAVFISTPHRGSYVAGGWIGRFARRLVSLPSNLTSFIEREDLPAELRQVPTSVENMEPDSRFVKVMSQLPFKEGIALHSIIAVRGRGDPVRGNDGVVAYASAHLDEAESELIVRHDHSVQGEPETIGELRRILFEHVGRDRAETLPREVPLTVP